MVKLKVPVVKVYLKPVQFGRQPVFRHDSPSPPARRKKPKAWMAVVLVLVVLTAAVALGFHNLNAPAEGTINQTSTIDTKSQDPYANPGKYSGQYIGFTYPAHYKQVPAQKTGSYLEVAGFYGSDATSKQISVGVLKESIGDDSGVKLRRIETDKYQELPRNTTGIITFSSSVDGSERTAYVPHQDKVAIISISAPTGWDLSEDLNTIIYSLRWK
jgi:hypothetical protein